MKTLPVLLSFLLIAGALLMGTSCAKNTRTGNDINSNPSYLRTGTLQGKIMDALTGKAIGGDDLEVYLLQGVDTSKPEKLVKDLNDPLVGEYAFNSIPVGVVDAANNELNYKLVVIKGSYQRFEANISLTATVVPGNAQENITNEMFNRIGNIYLYRLCSSPCDVSVYVYSPQGRPIENASVLLKQNCHANAIIANVGDRILPAAGLYPSLTAFTNSSGKAVFSGSNLTLGGSYSVVVQALTFEGQQLVTATPAAFIIGEDSLTRVVNMEAISNTLVATSASNSVPGTITPNGSLTISFNQPVIIDTDAFTAISTHGDPITPTVTALLSTDCLTLMLTPVWATAPVSTDNEATITYTYSGDVYLKNSPESGAYTLFGGITNNTSGDTISGVVRMTYQNP
ncbi:hypothetical protein ACFLT3_00555 [Chloroflexota bacterium]